MEKKKSQLIKKEDLYDFNITYVKTIVIDGTREIQYHNSSYIQMLMEKVLWLFVNGCSVIHHCLQRDNTLQS